MTKVNTDSMSATEAAYRSQVFKKTAGTIADHMEKAVIELMRVYSIPADGFALGDAAAFINVIERPMNRLQKLYSHYKKISGSEDF